ncbi:MAG TPA: FAD-binding protein, partial [Sphingobium sp.]
KGGLAVDADARVLDRGGTPIEGLYACGDVAATVMGFGYAGAGASLGPAMTFALLAAEAVIRDRVV